jgi:hypothetical protein
MEGTFQPSSFIPKAPLDPGTSRKKSRRNLSGFMILAIIIFILSLLLGAGAFIYNQYIQASIQNKKDKLTEVKANLQVELIEDLKRLDERLTVGEQLLNEHTAISPLFFLIEDNTLRSVRLTNFVFADTGVDYTVTLQGQTDSYTSVALQADQLGKDRAIFNPIFSNFLLDPQENVFFDVTFTVAPRTLQDATYIGS